MTDDERMGRAVRAELARALVSAREMSRRLGWSAPYLSTRLTGQVSFRVSELQAIAAQLDIPVTRFYETPPPRPAPDTPAAAVSDAG